ncbi:MAG: UvrD-helicase domain-containing protein [Bdellovibrionaceae bacterium]|nr:UvrD-helicase domain-containing protein [Pseudobdellovibrionaceae bacterium]
MQSPSFNVKKIIKAGAGAGKTTTLVNDLYSFFNQFKNNYQRQPRVVVTTFTKKATQELKERLLKKAIQENDESFFVYINNKNLIHISTIHGVLNLLIKQNLTSFGLKSNVSVISDSDEDVIEKKILRNLFTENDSYVDLLNHYSTQDLLSFVKSYSELKLQEKNFTVYSSEKFKKIVESQIEIIFHQVSQSIEVISDEKLSKTWQVWIDSFKEYSAIKGVTKKEVLLNWVELNSTKPRLPKETQEASWIAQKNIYDSIDQTRALIKNNYFEVDLFERFSTFHMILTELGEQFHSQKKMLKRSNALMTMRDIELLVSEKLIQGDNFYSQFADTWDFWMIDEYQDTSPLQEQILFKLIGEKSNFLVGDPQQSIYLFRGARSEIFKQKFDEYQRLGRHEIKDKNYRSYRGVLSFINSFFTNEFTQFQAMEYEKSNSLQTYDVEYFEVEEELELEKVVVCEIEKLLVAGENCDSIAILSRDNKSLLKMEKVLRQTSIPYYYHSAGKFFKKREVLDLLQFIKFLFNPHDDINLISLLRSPWVGLTDRKIKELKSFSKNSNQRSFFSSLGWLKEKKILETDFIFLEKLNFYLEAFADKGLSAILKKFAIHSGLLLTSQHQDPSGKMEANIWKVINWVDEIYNDPQLDILFEVDQVLRSGRLQVDEEMETSALVEPKRVQLMTVHASKGLQFKYLFLLSADKKMMPRKRSYFSFSEETKEWSFIIKTLDEGANIYSPLAEEMRSEFAERESEEYWRLLYVALTRAQEKILIFSGETVKNTWSEKLKNFLSAVNANKLNEVGFRQRINRITNENFQDFQLKEHSFAETKKPTKSIDVEDSLGSGIYSHFFQNQLQNFEETKSKESTWSVTSKNDLSFTSEKPSVRALWHKEKGVKLHQSFEYSEQHLDQMKKMDANIPWDNILRDGYREFGFAFKVLDRQLIGSIDIWAEANQIFYVVDYKTGLKENNTKYFEQLEFYAQALNHLKLVPDKAKIELILVYFSLNKVVKKEYLLTSNVNYFHQLFN